MMFPGVDPAYGTPAPTNQLVANNNIYSSLESRLSAVEARLADEEEQAEECPGLDWVDTSCARPCVKIGGRLHADWASFADQNAASADPVNGYGNLRDYVEFRRLRLFACGEAYGVMDYKVELDFAPEVGYVDDGAIGIRDVYIGFHEVPWLGYTRMGYFREPISMENLTDANYLTFLERGLPNVFLRRTRVNQQDQLALDDTRAMGIAACNHTDGMLFTLGYGAFFNGLDDRLKEKVADHQGIDLTIRGTMCPWYQADGRGVLHMGVAYSYQDEQEDVIRYVTTPEIGEFSNIANQPAAFANQGALDTGFFAARFAQLWQAELAAVYGTLSMQAEFFYAQPDGINGVPDMDFYGLYCYGSWFLTGENRVYRRCTGTFGRVIPNTNFWLVRTCNDGCDMGWGAWELAARWSYLEFEDPFLAQSSLGGKLNDLTVGVNWYWNPNMRLMLNWIHSWGDLNSLAAGDTAETDILAARVQLDF
jgi:phosphate-selective porin OprO/OprP